MQRWVVGGKKGDGARDRREDIGEGSDEEEGGDDVARELGRAGDGDGPTLGPRFRSVPPLLSSQTRE